MTYKEMEERLAHQKAFGVDMSRYADTEGRIEAEVCDCGLFRRDAPPATYVCGCGRRLESIEHTERKVMCVECSAKILTGGSSYTSYEACESCRNKNPGEWPWPADKELHFRPYAGWSDVSKVGGTPLSSLGVPPRRPWWSYYLRGKQRR